MIPFKKPRNVTFVLLTLFILAAISYKFFPAPLYLFHKFFLGIYVPGLSLSKALIFFLFILMFFLVRDMLPPLKFSFRRIIFYQAIILLGVITIAAFGFAVFTRNIDNFNLAFPGGNVHPGTAGVIYSSAEAKTMFFYSMSATDHIHENKAYFFPILTHFGIEGDIGEAVYPFYPKLLLATGYLILALILFSIGQCVRLLNFKNCKLDLFLSFAFLFSCWRLLHSAYDGGMMYPLFPFDIAAFLVFTIALAGTQHGKNSFSALLLFLAIATAPIVKMAMPIMLTWAYGINSHPSLNMQKLAFLEALSIVLTASILAKPDLKRALRENKFAALVACTTIIVVSLLAWEISHMEMKTAMDSADFFISHNPKAKNYNYWLLTSTTLKNPCNLNPLQQFQVKGKIIRVYPFTPDLSCSTDKKWYSYPLVNDRYETGKVVLDCDEILKAGYERRGGVCYVAMHNKFEFFLLSTLDLYPSKHTYRAFRLSK